MKLISGEYTVRHCNNGPCPQEYCGTNRLQRYKAEHSCCDKQTASAPNACEAAPEPKGTKRIIGGESADKDAWPWMVFINGDFGVCGGALISPTMVLSAAHCAQTDHGVKFDLTSMRVSAGIVHLDDYLFSNFASGLVIREVAETIVYPDYSYPQHDIALFRLNESMPFSSSVRPVCLPHGEETKYDTKCIAMGWGVSDTLNQQITYHLQQVGLYNFDPAACIGAYDKQEDLKQYVPFLKKRRGYMCIGSLNENKDSCSGDSGGAVVCQRCNSCSWYAAGVVSFGPNPCATMGTPAIYTKVVDYEEWIYHHTGITRKTSSCVNNP